jgi:hypothetical protein
MSSRLGDPGRRYLPAEYMLRFGVDEGQIEGRVFTPEFRAMMQAWSTAPADAARRRRAQRTRRRELRVTLDLFRKGGEAILDGIAAQDYDVLRGRPVVTKRKKMPSSARRTAGQAAGRALRGSRRACVSPVDSNRALRLRKTEAYAVCRDIARREAKNFYWAFRVLPRTRATPCAPSTPSCAAPTTSPTTNPSRSRPAAQRWTGGCSDWRASRIPSPHR